METTHNENQPAPLSSAAASVKLRDTIAQFICKLLAGEETQPAAGELLAMAKKRIVSLRCPTCRTLVLASDEDFPFCSDRCRTIDLAVSVT